MTTPRWRGTLIYVGSLAAMGAAGFTKFAVLAPEATVAESSTDGASTAQAATTDPATSTDTETTTTDTVTVVGSSVSTRYGPVQVSVTFSAGQITDVQVLQVPGGHHESVQINARATPILAQEVVDAQSAQVDTVSGATYTSEAYAESVQSAIDQRG
ncbi:FMN-binding protein [uncultured Cellulomonas sp.]|uniref:FMN-binding protein n=1 Tax=uncultured Cellulomonas sp. TaxID=189682 RepID=UPI0028E508C5|nr:FMN-binding protein [uncultured Cellulomonas sp.]